MEDGKYTQADIDLFFEDYEIEEAGPHIVPKPRVANPGTGISLAD